MNLASVVERLSSKQIICLLRYCENFILQVFKYAFSLNCISKNDYRLSAKRNHRITMTPFLNGALDVFRHTLKRALLRKTD